MVPNARMLSSRTCLKVKVLNTKFVKAIWESMGYASSQNLFWNVVSVTAPYHFRVVLRLLCLAAHAVGLWNPLRPKLCQNRGLERRHVPVFFNQTVKHLGIEP